MRKLSWKALIAGTITTLVLCFIIALIVLNLVAGASDLVLLIIDIFISIASVFAGTIIAGRLAPKAGPLNGTVVAILAWILFTVLLIAFGDMETAAIRIQSWYGIFLWALFGGLGGSIGTRWAESKMSAQAWIDRGNEFSQKQVYNKALKCYDRALKLDPDNPTALNLKSSTASNFETIREKEHEISGERYGSFAVNKVHMIKPNMQYAFIFMRDKLIAANIGGQFSTKAQTENIEELENMPVNTILEADKKNFEIHYDQILKMEVKKSLMGINGARSGIIKITAMDMTKEQYDIAVGQVYEDCVKILQSALPTKLELK